MRRIDLFDENRKNGLFISMIESIHSFRSNTLLCEGTLIVSHQHLIHNCLIPHVYNHIS